MLDIVRRIAEATSPWPILVRALVVTPVYLRVGGDGRVETSRAGDEAYVHVYSSPLRLTAGLSVDVEELTIREVFVADLVDQAGGRLGVRIDPGLETEQVVPPGMAAEVRSVAAGLPARAALTAGEGEELRVERGPEEVADLRTWPVYSVVGAVQDPMVLSEAVQHAAGVPIVLLIDGRPEQLAELIDVDAHGLVLR